MHGSGGRLLTWIVLVAIGALAGAATLDAVRGRAAADPTGERSTQRPARVPHIAAELAAARVEGELSYVDGGCHAHALRLPALAPADAPRPVLCRFASPHLPSYSFFVHPDGTTGAIRAEVGPLLGARSPRDVVVNKLAWLDESRVAAIVSSRSSEIPQRTVIAVVDGGELVGSVPWFPSRSARFFVSPHGSFFALATKGPARFFLLDRNARPGVLADVARDWFGRTSLTGARAVTWSPDEHWTALAKNESVYVFTTYDRDPDPKLVRLPIAARDLAWD